MDKLLKLLLEAAEAEERSLWYSHGQEVEQRSLAALVKVLEHAQYRLNNDGEN